MTKLEKMRRELEALRKSRGGSLPDEILVGVLLWGDLQISDGFTVNEGLGTIEKFPSIPVKVSKGLHSQSWALIYNYR